MYFRYRGGCRQETTSFRPENDSIATSHTTFCIRGDAAPHKVQSGICEAGIQTLYQCNGNGVYSMLYVSSTTHRSTFPWKGLDVSIQRYNGTRMHRHLSIIRWILWESVIQCHAHGHHSRTRDIQDRELTRIAYLKMRTSSYGNNAVVVSQTTLSQGTYDMTQMAGRITHKAITRKEASLSVMDGNCRVLDNPLTPEICHLATRDLKATKPFVNKKRESRKCVTLVSFHHAPQQKLLDQ